MHFVKKIKQNKNTGQLQKRAAVRGALPAIDIPLQVCIKSFKKTGTAKTRYSGCVADIRVWSIVHSKEHLAQSWGLPLTGAEHGLVGYWPFDEVCSRGWGGWLGV